MADIQALLAALDVFSCAPDKASLDRANSWLQDFQHSPEAWATCNVLLLSPDAPLPAKQFAAQTFRTKVTYDLHELDQAAILSIRDTLLTAMERLHSGPKSIIVQLSLAISGLALQLPSWNVVQTMVDTFGRNPDAVMTLLQFLTLLPEEVNTNARIPITDEEFRERSAQLLTENATQVLELLSMYIQASGVTAPLQCQVFDCLYNWLYAGEISTTDLSKSPLFSCAFEALNSDQLFDSAVNVITELIHETQEIEDNMDVIGMIFPRLTAIRPLLAKYWDDSDKISGFARILSEAGETYRMLILQHMETFFPLVEAIGECAAHEDIDIIQITFPFWMRLAGTIGKKPSVPPLLVEAYRALMGVIINKLHFTPENSTGQAADDFRSFRHVMGDTLKDCCVVLRTDNCLLAAYQMITTVLARGPEAVTWQEIEAPLFAMRSMGAEIDPDDNNAVPKIMDLIPLLPNHPRVRYAALLIIARYTPWIDRHSSYIPAQLQYISSGFDDADPEVSAAAGQALKYLCQDCKAHLVDFIPTLHAFLSTTGSKLLQEDRRQVYEAIAYVISAMPMDQAAQSLRTFALDILSQVHAITTKQTPPTKEEFEEVGNGLENLETMMHIIGGFGEDLPPACQGTCEEAWGIFDRFLAKFGNNYDLAERTTRVLRHGLTLFGESCLPIAASVIARMSLAFEATGFPSFIWIAGKIVGTFGNEEDPTLRSAFQETYERTTRKVASFLSVKTPGNIPDVLEDYMQLLHQILDYAPDIFFVSSAFPLVFQAGMATLTLVHTDILFATLNLFRTILTHDCLLSDTAPVPPPKFPIYASAIRQVMDKEGFNFLNYLLNGLVGDFPDDSTATVVSIFRAIVVGWPSEVLVWLPPILQQIPPTAAPVQSKTQFLSEVTTAINQRQFDKVKYAILALNRASKKARERRRAILQRG
ncbi:armadillo-type protein [Crucibulum laeve]|uniref:Armadillo-type protein n=1 Tax=Crucibulum laeve TaxID=68775 RepID=A0A5C3M789_9AGAR|nr:armadillo-type protein [Crucibulum laeve]